MILLYLYLYLKMLSKLLYIVRKYSFEMEKVFSVVYFALSRIIFESLLDKEERIFFYNAYFIIYRFIGYNLLVLLYLGFKPDNYYIYTFLIFIASNSVFTNFCIVFDQFINLSYNIKKIDNFDNNYLSYNLNIDYIPYPVDLELIYLIKLTCKFVIYIKFLLEILFLCYLLYLLTNFMIIETIK